jgi:hypothetical protein
LGGNIDAHRGRSVNLEKFEKLFHQNAIKLENRGTPLDFSQTPNAPEDNPNPPSDFLGGKGKGSTKQKLTKCQVKMNLT